MCKNRDYRDFYSETGWCPSCKDNRPFLENGETGERRCSICDGKILKKKRMTAAEKARRAKERKAQKEGISLDESVLAMMRA